MLRPLVPLVSVLALLAGCPGFGLKEPTLDGGVLPVFEDNVRAAFEVACGACHGPNFTDDGAPMGFRLDRCEAEGEVLGAREVLPLSLFRVFDTPDNPMPPSGRPPMASADAQLIKAWQALGAPCTEAELMGERP
jgi:hypothetical protein